EFVLPNQISHRGAKHSVRRVRIRYAPGGMNLVDQRPDLYSARLAKVAAVNPRVKSLAGRVTVRIVTDPAVEMHRRVQRLRTVPHKMSHHTHDINDVRLRVGDFLRRAAVFLEGLEITK